MGFPSLKLKGHVAATMLIDALSTSKGMIMNQVFPVSSEEISDDEYLKETSQASEEEQGCLAMPDENNLHNVEFPKAVLDTHKAMSEAIEARMQDKTGQLRFYSDYTGRGKTTGAILTIGEKISDPKHDMKRALFLTRECAGVEEVYRQFKATWPDLSVVPWSGAHKVSGTIALDVERNDVTEDEAKEAQIVISTHSAAKTWMKNRNYKLGKDFDFVLVDEYPEPVTGGTLKPSAAMAWQEQHQYGRKGEVLEKVSQWMQDLQDKPIDQLERPEWAQMINDDFPEAAVEMAKAVCAGRSFVTQKGKWKALQWAEIQMPLAGRALLCSATNELEGWQLDPNLKTESLVAHRGEATDYSQVQVTFKPWPELAKTLNPDLGDKGTVAAFREQITNELDNLPNDGGDVFVLMPKNLKEGLKTDFIESVASRHNGQIMFQHWGAGIGSNAYQNCSHAIIVGLHHLNALGVNQKVKAHSHYKSDKLEHGGTNTALVKTTKENEHARQVIQMLNRIRIRQMERDSENPFLAKAANIVWIATEGDTGTIAGVLRGYFKDISIDRAQVPEGFMVVDDVGSLRWEERGKWVGNRMERLGVKEFTYSDVDTQFGIRPKGSRQTKKFKVGLEAIGWQVVVGNGRSNPTIFHQSGTP